MFSLPGICCPLHKTIERSQKCTTKLCRQKIEQRFCRRRFETTFHQQSTNEYHILSYPIISYHIVDLKRQNRLKVGTDKPKLKVKMQSVSDDDVRK